MNIITLKQKNNKLTKNDKYNLFLYDITSYLSDTYFKQFKPLMQKLCDYEKD